MKRCIILLAMFILLCTSVSSVVFETVNTFNNSLGGENLSITTSTPLTRYLNITMNPLIAPTNISFDCRLDRNFSLPHLRTNISVPGNATIETVSVTIFPISNAYDGNGSTYFDTSSSAPDPTIVLNYTWSSIETDNITISFNYEALAAGHPVYLYNYTGGSYDSIGVLVLQSPNATLAFNVILAEFGIFNASHNISLRITDPGSARLIIREIFVEHIVVPNNLKVNISNTEIELSDADNFCKSDYNGGGIYEGYLTTLNNIIDGGCVCEGCIYTGYVCTIPHIFSSNGAVTIEYFDLIASNSITKFNISIIDSKTNSLLSGLNMTIQHLSSANINSTTTVTGHTLLNISEFVVSDTVEIRVFQTVGSDYSIVIRSFDIIRSTLNNLLVYVSNTSDIDTTNLVTFLVQDQDQYSLQDATITIQRQDPTTNTFLTVTQITTNPSGEATTILHTDTVFYKFLVDFNGERVFTSPSPITLSINDDDINLACVVGGDEIDYWKTYTTAVTLTYINLTNSSGYFTMDYTDSSELEACFDLKIVNSTGVHDVELLCQNATSGTITSSILTPNNVTLYFGRGMVDTKDGQGYRVIKTITRFIGQVTTPFKTETGFLLIFIVLAFCIFGFLGSIEVGLVALMVSSLIMAFTNFVPAFTPTIAASIITLCGLCLFTISRLDQ